MSVTNIGDEAQSYFGGNQKLVDTSGREYQANSEADMWANKGTGDINPGNSIQVQAAFDVPPGTQPRRVGGSRLDVLGRRKGSALTRDRETIDSELRLLAAMRRVTAEEGVDTVFDELLSVELIDQVRFTQPPSTPSTTR